MTFDPVQPPAQLDEVERTADAPKSRRGLIVPLVLLVGLVLLAIFALPFISILFNIVNPPQPPLPGNLSLIRQQNYDYGIDEWWYSTPQDPCDVLRFFREQGAQCTVSPLQCDRAEQTTGDFTQLDTVVARCAGAAEFSLFSMSWWALITRDPANPQTSQIDVWRGINWLSTTDPSNPDAAIEAEATDNPE